MSKSNLFIKTLSAGLMLGTATCGTGLAYAQQDAAPVLNDSSRLYAPYSFAPLIKKVKPAVVSIQVGVLKEDRLSERRRERGDRRRDNRRQGNRMPRIPGIPEDHPLYKFFKGEQQKRPRFPSRAEGSGFVISADGYIVTNNHVVSGHTKVQVIFDDGKKMVANVIGTDKRTDLALLKLTGKGPFKFVEFATTPVQVGDRVLAIGNPFGLAGSVTAGIVSALRRPINSSPYDYIQIDAAVNKGNSGGPAFNLEGKVIGINSAILSPSGTSAGIAFAVPAETAMRIIKQLKEYKVVRRGYLGVNIQDVTDEIAESLDMPKAEGALVSQIRDDGPAVNSDIQVQDAIVAVNGQPVKNSRDLARKIGDLPPGSDVRLTVFRDGKTREVTIKLGLRDKQTTLARLKKQDRPQPAPYSQTLRKLGLSLAPANRNNSDQDKGALVRDVERGSIAEERGFQTGDVILKVGSRKVSRPGDVSAGIADAAKKGRKYVLFQIKTKSGRLSFRPVPIE